MINEYTASSRGLWALVIMLAGSLGGVLAGLSMRLAGGSLPVALAAAGGAFVSLASLGMAVHRFVREEVGPRNVESSRPGECPAADPAGA